MSNREKNLQQRLRRQLIKKREGLLDHSFDDLISENIIDKCREFIINPLNRHMLLIKEIVTLINWTQVANNNQLVPIFNYFANILLVDKQSKLKYISIASNMIVTIQHTWNCRIEKKLSSSDAIKQLMAMRLFIKTLSQKKIINFPDISELFNSLNDLDIRLQNLALDFTDYSNINENLDDEIRENESNKSDILISTPEPQTHKISNEIIEYVESQLEDFPWNSYLFACFIHILY